MGTRQGLYTPHQVETTMVNELGITRQEARDYRLNSLESRPDGDYWGTDLAALISRLRRQNAARNRKI